MAHVLIVNHHLTGAKRREFSGMIHWLTINNHPSNPQQPIHSLRLAPVRKWMMTGGTPVTWGTSKILQITTIHDTILLEVDNQFF